MRSVPLSRRSTRSIVSTRSSSSIGKASCMLVSRRRSTWRATVAPRGTAMSHWSTPPASWRCGARDSTHQRRSGSTNRALLRDAATIPRQGPRDGRVRFPPPPPMSSTSASACEGLSNDPSQAHLIARCANGSSCRRAGRFRPGPSRVASRRRGERAPCPGGRH